MKELRDEPLRKHTSLRIGGPARRMVVPESPDELVEVARAARRQGTRYVVLGRGSNVLAADEPIDLLIIKNTEACRLLARRDDGLIEVGASVELQRLVRFCVEHDRDGMEYLQSVPGNVGGAICMNAGRGKQYNQSISDYLVSVDVFDGDRVVTLAKEQCRFGYRRSVFRRRDWVILAARFAPPDQPKAVGLEKIAERMRYVREVQDNHLPNAGTVFAHHFRFGSQLMGQRVNDAQFSTKTPNWIVNTGQATCKDVRHLVRKAQWQHVLRGRRPPQLEWVLLE